MIALLSIIGSSGGDPKKTTDQLLQIVFDTLGPSSAAETFSGFPSSRSPFLTLMGVAGFAPLVIGLLTALWSASGYVGAFGRAANAIYEVEEGRPFYKLRPVQLVVTLVCVVLLAGGWWALALVVTGPVTSGDRRRRRPRRHRPHRVGHREVAGHGPGRLGLLIFRCSTSRRPTSSSPKFKWFTLGGLVAVVVWVAGLRRSSRSTSANFGSYNKTYGTLGGVVIFLVWLWITNLAVLVGAEFNAELERSREIEAGEPGRRARDPASAA